MSKLEAPYNIETKLFIDNEARLVQERFSPSYKLYQLDGRRGQVGTRLRKMPLVPRFPGMTGPGNPGVELGADYPPASLLT